MTGSVGGDATAASRGTAALAGVQILARVLGLAFVVVITRGLDPSDVGRYSTISALLLIAGSVADFGTTTVITRDVSRQPSVSNALLRGSMFFSGGLGLLCGVGVLGYVFAADYPAELKMDAVLAVWALPIEATLTSMLAALDGRGLIARRSLITLARTGIVTGWAIGAVLLGGGARVAIGGLVLGPAVAWVAAYVMTTRSGVWTGRIGWDREAATRLAVRALPFAVLGGLNVIIMRFDVVLLSLLRDAATTARYDMALRAVDAVSFLGVVVATPALFVLSKRLGAGDREGAQRAFDEAVRLTYFVGLGLTIGLVVLHRPLIELIAGADFQRSAPLLAILGIQVWLALLAGVQGSLLLASDDLRRVLSTFGVVVAVAVGIDVVAIALWGDIGAAGAMVVIQVLVVAAAARIGLVVTGVRTPWPSPRLLCAAAVAGVGGLALMQSNWILAGLAIPTIYIGIAAASGAITVGDIRRVRTKLRGSV